MPIFDYECSECGHRFEALVRSASERVVCVQCGAENPKRKVSRFSPSVPASKTSCPSAAMCPAAAQGGCGCSGCCGHHH